MAISEYLDFVIEANDFERAEDGTARLRVQVSSSPAGKSDTERRSVSKGLDRSLSALRRRRMDLTAMIDLGEKLSRLLLSAQARQLFRDSLQGLEPHQGLRVRLHLPPGLAYIPWEYMYMKPEGSRKDETGFLALDPQVSIMRHEASAPSKESDIVLETCRLLVVTAEPRDARFPALDLSQERGEIADALRDVTAIELCFLEDPSVQQLCDNLLPGAGIFHFAGHGQFTVEMGAAFGTLEGEGSLVLVGDDGVPEFWAPGKLAVNLRGNGIQLAVINSGESGRRDKHDAAGGLAASLVEARIPAVVAMHYSLRDASATAFCRSLYRALAAGLPLDRAVAEGRRAIFNCTSEGDRDWGVPVLYLQAPNLVLQPPSEAPSGSEEVDQGALRKVLVEKFEIEDLEALCADLEEALKKDGVELEVNLDIVGGTGQEAKVLRLIRYLDNRGHVNYLVRAVQQARPDML